MPYSRDDRDFIEKHGGNLCANCGIALGDTWHADDILAQGHTGPFSGRRLCPDCHEDTITYGRGQKGIIEFYTG